MLILPPQLAKIVERGGPLSNYVNSLPIAGRRIGIAALFLAAILFQGPATSLAAQPALTLKPIITGVNRPVAVTHAGDGSGRLFVTLQAGQIIIYDGEEVLPTPFLDILSLVGCCGERGLLSAAFHPNYASSGRNYTCCGERGLLSAAFHPNYASRPGGFFFVNYTNNSGDTVIARYSVSSDPNLADPDSAVILMTISQPFSNHNGGQLNFGADGYLYIGMGDGGSAGDPGDRAQDPAENELLGKMLRIDVDGALPYGIPPTAAIHLLETLQPGMRFGRWGCATPGASASIDLPEISSSSAVEPPASPRRRTDRPRRPTPPVRAPPSWRRVSGGPNPVRWLASNGAPGCEPRSRPRPGGAEGCRGWPGSAPDRGGAECPRRRRHGHGVACAVPERLRSSPRRSASSIGAARVVRTMGGAGWRVVSVLTHPPPVTTDY